MADFEEITPQRFIIDVINFGCDDYGMRIRIYSYYYDKGYREMGDGNLPFSHCIYKIVKIVKPNLLKRIWSWLTLN